MTSTATLLSQDLHLRSANAPPRPRSQTGGTSKTTSFVLEPVPLQLGGHDPATIEGTFTASGYSLHLTGNVTTPRLEALAGAVPPLGEGLMRALPENHPVNAPFHIDLTATKHWHSPQTWVINAPSHQQAGQMRSRRRAH
jgi:AsmA protein